MLLLKPTEIDISFASGGLDEPLGSFVCKFAPPPPITESEANAIKSRPGGSKSITLQLQCNKCNDSIRLFTELVKEDQPLTPEGALRLDDASDVWVCGCTLTKIPLTYMKKGIHDLFRHSGPKEIDLFGTFRPMYEEGAIGAIVRKYQALLASHPREEAVQVFLAANLVFWNFLSPAHVLIKPKILTKHTADFGVLTTSKILYLVEIEKPQTKLVKKDGGIHSEFQAGLNQIRDWRVVVQNHRTAFLDSLELSPDRVHDIRYMLIAGLAHEVPEDSLEKLRRDESVTFYCFDELASFLHSTLSAIRHT